MANDKQFTVRAVTRVAVCLALLSICSKITIPTPAIQFTLQTFAVTFTAFFLGGRLGALTQFLFVVMGLIGLPVFSAGGGPGYIMKPSFGYLVAFIPASFLIGYLLNKFETRGMKPFRAAVLAGLAGLAVIYTIGTAYFFAIGKLYLGMGAKPFTWFLWGGALMFLPTDALSVTVAAAVMTQVRKALPEKKKLSV